MSVKKWWLLISLLPSIYFLPSVVFAEQSLSASTLAADLGWQISDENHCHGYYLEEPFIYPVDVEKKN
jgi:hypothetical protein